MVGRVDELTTRPAPLLADLVSGYQGSRHEGFQPGTHLGLPSPELEVIICLSDPIRLAAMPDPAQPPGSFTALAAGLHTRPAVIAHDGHTYSVSIGFRPEGARYLLGVPAAELANTVVGLDALLGRPGTELVERLAAEPDWRGRFARLDEFLVGRLRAARSGPDRASGSAVGYAWRRIVDTGGRVRIDDLAGEAGLSRQHLTRRFRVELGLTPKQAARVVRFDRSRRLLRDLERSRRQGSESGQLGLAGVAAWCGYSDQAHLARDWRELAGCPASVWLAAEELPFVQADPSEGR